MKNRKTAILFATIGIICTLLIVVRNHWRKEISEESKSTMKNEIRIARIDTKNESIPTIEKQKARGFIRALANSSIGIQQEDMEDIRPTLFPVCGNPHRRLAGP